jgi:superfamily II DNA helicase RecQ
MALRFFQIPARGCEQTETEVNGFLQSHRVLTVDRRWVDAGENSFWAICVDYLDSSGRDSTRKSGKGRQNQIDYREVLTPEEFVKFSSLRDLRKALAASDGVPVYAVMTNEQLAQIVQNRVTDRQGLGKIPGLGDARIEKYSDRILEVMNPDSGERSEASQSSV